VAAAGPRLAALLQALQTAETPAEAPSVTKAFDGDAVLAALHTMAGQLRNADMAATDAMIELKRQFGATLGAQLQPMDEAICMLDFARALHLCEALANELTEGQPA
jgi:hypothetical protein